MSIAKEKHNFVEFRENISYEKALRYQGFLNSEGITGLLSFSCPPTITLGKVSCREDIIVSDELLENRKVTVFATDRGGKATYHGPGQLVGFPLTNLFKSYGDARAIRRFSEDLLMGLAHACAALGVKSVETRSGYPGLWTSRGKLASLGIAVKDGYVFHGFSLNLNEECMQGFSLINPCGIPTCKVTSLEREGVEVECLEQLTMQISPYLGGLFNQSYKDSTIVKHKSTQDELFSKVSRSPMALEQIHEELTSSQSVHL